MKVTRQNALKIVTSVHCELQRLAAVILAMLPMPPRRAVPPTRTGCTIPAALDTTSARATATSPVPPTRDGRALNLHAAVSYHYDLLLVFR